MNSVDFQDEAAVKDYLDRLGIEYRFQCFHEERPDGCHRLGDWLEFAKKDWAKAGRIFKSNCDLYEYGHSCFKYGNYLFLGRGMKEKDKTKATEYYKKGCDAKDVYPGVSRL
jgi:cytochrome c oxidase assembly factor 7